MLRAKHYWRSLSCAMVILFLAVSCAETIIMDPEEKMPLVVNCVLERNRDSLQFLDLYRARRPSEGGYTPVTDALVSVSGGEKIYLFTWNGERWESKFEPEFSTFYRLEIRTKEGENLNASTLYPADFKVEYSLADSDFDGSIPYDKIYPYGGYYFSIGSYHSKLVQQMTVGHNTFSFYEQRYAYSPYGDELFAWITAGEKLSTDHSGADPFNLCEGTWKDLDMSEDIMTEMWKQEYIDYCSPLPVYQGFLRIHQRPGYTGGNIDEKLLLDRSYMDPFKEGPQEVPIDRFFILATDTADQDDFLNVQYGHGRRYHVFQVRFVSREYDAYLKKLVSDKVIHSGEFSELYSMEPMYSNIEGGQGIFGAQWVTFGALGFSSWV